MSRKNLRLMLRAIDGADVGRKGELQERLRDAAERAGTTVAALREYASGPVQYSFNGLAGCVMQRRSRLTGTVVGLYEADQAGLDREAGRWATVCEPHSTSVNHDTLATARAHLPDPTGWCDACRDAGAST